MLDQQEPEPVIETVEREPHVIEKEVEAWFAGHFHNLGPRLDTDTYNHFVNAKEKLKQRLLALWKD